jgi:8-oxo-dGTP diphosphatase
VKKKYCYEYPRPAVTVDIVLFRDHDGAREVLLIRRKSDPYAGKWALPGGFVDQDEKLEAAASRELQEETGLTRVKLRQLGAFGDPGRDPRGHTVSIAFTAEVGPERKVRGGDDADEAEWFSLAKLPPLAFDHRKIIRKATEG